MSATHDPEQAAHRADVVVLAVQSQGLRENLVDWASVLPRDAVLVSLMKGVEIGTVKRMSEVIGEVTGAGPERIAVVSGPNLAKEIMSGMAAATVIATEDLTVATEIQRVFRRGLLRVYTNHDVIGCEVGGALKNVVAIATGIAQGLGVGDNTRAGVISRGLAELTTLAVAMGGEPSTLAGLAGILAAVLPARRASRIDMLRALAAE